MLKVRACSEGEVDHQGDERGLTSEPLEAATGLKAAIRKTSGSGLIRQRDRCPWSPEPRSANCKADRLS